MASKISLGGNFNTAASWGVVDATSLLDSEANNVVLATAASWTSGAGFTPGAIIIDGIAVKIYNRAASPSGTVTIRLYNVTDAGAVVGTTVTLNVSDIPSITTAGTTNEGGWVFFKFSSPVTLIAGKQYRCEGQTSSATQVTLFRDATASNFSRMLRTTTTGAPGAADILHIIGEHTGAGTGNDITITIDQVATSFVDLGSGTDATTAVTVGKRGTLQYAYAASTNYYLKCSGNLIVYRSGTFTIGTVANPIPRNGTAVLEFDPVADGGMGLIVRNGATFTAQGLSRTIGKNIVSCKLNVDSPVNDTVLDVDTDTGWLDNDVIVVASTSQTYTQTEKGAINVTVTATQLTVDGFGGAGGGLANAHLGTSPYQAEVILLTRNVIIRSATSTLMSYCDFYGTSTVDIDWVEFYYLGENAAGKYGVCPRTLAGGSLSIQYSSLHDFEDGGFYSDNNSPANITFSYNVMYNCNNAGTAKCALGSSSAIAGSSVVITYNILLLCRGSSNVGSVYLAYGFLFITFQNNTIAASNGIGLTVNLGSNTDYVTGTFSNNLIHSCSSYGMTITGYTTPSYYWSTFSYFSILRCNTAGLSISDAGSVNVKIARIIFDNFTIIGNSTSNIEVSSAFLDDIIISNSVIKSDATFTTTNGFNVNVASYRPAGLVKFINCTFGVTYQHTYDITIPTICSFRFVLNNCNLASTSPIGSPSYLMVDSFITSAKNAQSAGNHKSWYRFGTISSDTTYYHTASPSERLTPNLANIKLESGSKKVAVANGQTVTISVYVRKSTVASGGALYNGNQPRLMLRRNDAVGITSDTIIETQHVEGATANWEMLTGTTAAVNDDGVLEFFVDCDGTAGFVNVDDWSVV
jgi:hypothetical protein